MSRVMIPIPLWYGTHGFVEKKICRRVVLVSVRISSNTDYGSGISGVQPCAHEGNSYTVLYV